MLHPLRMKQEKDRVLLQNGSAFFDLLTLTSCNSKIYFVNPLLVVILMGPPEVEESSVLLLFVVVMNHIEVEGRLRLPSPPRGLMTSRTRNLNPLAPEIS